VQKILTIVICISTLATAEIDIKTMMDKAKDAVADINVTQVLEKAKDAVNDINVTEAVNKAKDAVADINVTEMMNKAKKAVTDINVSDMVEKVKDAVDTEFSWEASLPSFCARENPFCISSCQGMPAMISVCFTCFCVALSTLLEVSSS